MIFRDSYNWILRIQKKIDTRASIYVMFRDCTRLEKDVFVTWKEDDVNEQDVDERKECWKRKRVLSHIWVKPEPDLGQISTRLLTSSNQSWYARNTWLILISKMICRSFFKSYVKNIKITLSKVLSKHNH